MTNWVLLSNDSIPNLNDSIRNSIASVADEKLW